MFYMPSLHWPSIIIWQGNLGTDAASISSTIRSCHTQCTTSQLPCDTYSLSLLYSPFSLSLSLSALFSHTAYALRHMKRARQRNYNLSTQSSALYAAISVTCVSSHTPIHTHTHTLTHTHTHTPSGNITHIIS